MTGARETIKQSVCEAAILLLALASSANAQSGLPYTTYTSFSQVLEGGVRAIYLLLAWSIRKLTGTRRIPASSFTKCINSTRRGAICWA